MKLMSAIAPIQNAPTPEAAEHRRGLIAGVITGVVSFQWLAVGGVFLAYGGPALAPLGIAMLLMGTGGAGLTKSAIEKYQDRGLPSDTPRYPKVRQSAVGTGVGTTMLGLCSLTLAASLLFKNAAPEAPPPAKPAKTYRHVPKPQKARPLTPPQDIRPA